MDEMVSPAPFSLVPRGSRLADGTAPAQPAAFLDRDGVLNRALIRDGRPFPPRTAAQFELLPGVQTACQELAAAGLLLIVVSNQPDLARGDLAWEDLSAIHEVLITRLPIDAVLVCPHDDHHACGCRKPAPGLLTEAGRRFGVIIERSFVVGDRWRDIEAGQRIGCRTVFIDAGYDERRPESPDLTVVSLAEAVPWLLAEFRAEEPAR